MAHPPVPTLLLLLLQLLLIATTTLASSTDEDTNTKKLIYTFDYEFWQGTTNSEPTISEMRSLICMHDNYMTEVLQENSQNNNLLFESTNIHWEFDEDDGLFGAYLQVTLVADVIGDGGDDLSSIPSPEAMALYPFDIEHFMLNYLHESTTPTTYWNNVGHMSIHYEVEVPPEPTNNGNGPLEGGCQGGDAGNGSTDSVEEEEDSQSLSNSTDSVEEEDEEEEDSQSLSNSKQGEQQVDEEVSSKGLLNQATTTLAGGAIVKPKPAAAGTGSSGTQRCNDDSRGPLECLNPKHCFECTCRCDTGVWSQNPEERYGHMVAATSDGVLGDAGQIFCAQNNRVRTLLDDGKVECANTVVDSKTGEFIDCQKKWGRCMG